MSLKTSPKKVVFYVQHLMGVGHVRRTVLLAQATQATGIDVTVVSGGFPNAILGNSGLNVVQLPPCKATDETFKDLQTENGSIADDVWRNKRRDMLIAAIDQIAPDMLLIEMFPFGRGMLAFELLPLLEHLTSLTRPPLIVSSVRDILVKKDPERQLRNVKRLNTYFDALLVHGDENFIKLDETFDHIGKLTPEIFYTGYVAPQHPFGTKSYTPSNEVIVSVGGGWAGIRTLRSALEARALSQNCGDHLWRLLVPPFVASEIKTELMANAPEGVIVEATRLDFLELMARATVSISLGGYNTLVDVLSTRTAAVIVPFVTDSETEQEHRTLALDKIGLVTHLDEKTLTPQSLADAVDKAAVSPPPKAPLDMNGAQTTAAWIRSKLVPLLREEALTG